MVGGRTRSGGAQPAVFQRVAHQRGAALEAQFFHRARAKVLDQDVGLIGQLARNCQTFGILLRKPSKIIITQKTIHQNYYPKLRIQCHYQITIIFLIY